MREGAQIEWALQVDGHVYDDLSVWGTSLSEIDPTALIDVTSEQKETSVAKFTKNATETGY